MGAANDYHDSRIPTSVDGVEPAGHCPTKPFFQERTHMGLLKEFKEFAVKGNAIDMAVGIVIGAAFGNIVSSLVKDIVMPPLGLLLGNVDFSSLKIPLNDDAAIRYGVFINTIVNFLIVAFAIFLVIKQMNRLKKAPPAADPTEKECPKCCSVIPIKASRCPHCTSELVRA